jgi:hypothetical protein
VRRQVQSLLLYPAVVRSDQHLKLARHSAPVIRHLSCRSSFEVLSRQNLRQVVRNVSMPSWSPNDLDKSSLLHPL